MSNVIEDNRRDLEAIQQFETLSPLEQSAMLFNTGFRVRSDIDKVTVSGPFRNLAYTQQFTDGADIDSLSDTEAMPIRARLGLSQVKEWKSVVKDITDRTGEEDELRKIKAPSSARFREKMKLINLAYARGDEAEAKRLWSEKCEMSEEEQTTSDKLVKIGLDQIAPVNIAKFLSLPAIHRAWGSQNILGAFWPSYHFQDAVSEEMATTIAGELYNGKGPGFDLMPSKRPNDEPVLDAYRFYSKDIARAFVVYAGRLLKEADGQDEEIVWQYQETVKKIQIQYPDLRKLVVDNHDWWMEDRFVPNPTDTEDQRRMCAELNQGSHVAVILTQPVDLLDDDISLSEVAKAILSSVIVTESGASVPFSQVLSWRGESVDDTESIEDYLRYTFDHEAFTNVRSAFYKYIGEYFGGQFADYVAAEHGETPQEIVEIGGKLMRKRSAGADNPFGVYRYHAGILTDIRQNGAAICILPFGSTSETKEDNIVKVLLDQERLADEDEQRIRAITSQERAVELPSETQEAAQRLYDLGFRFQSYEQDGAYDVWLRNIFVQIGNKYMDYKVKAACDPTAAADPQLCARLGLEGRNDVMDILRLLTEINRRRAGAFSYIHHEEWLGIREEVINFVSSKPIYDVWEEELLVMKTTS